jgi:hypothetical protein
MIEPLDPVYAAEVDRFVAEYRDGRRSIREFCLALINEANTYNAASLLEYLPEAERTTFEWWFVNEYGSRIEHIGLDGRARDARAQPPEFIGHFGGSPAWSGLANAEEPIAVRNALHRAILARREPV